MNLNVEKISGLTIVGGGDVCGPDGCVPSGVTPKDSGISQHGTPASVGTDTPHEQDSNG